MKFLLIVLSILTILSCSQRSDPALYKEFIIVDNQNWNDQLANAYYESLERYFIGNTGNEEVEQFGDIIIIGKPHSFRTSHLKFRVNGKPFTFDNPPYYQNKLKWGRTVYFIEDDLNSKNSFDTVTIKLYKHKLGFLDDRYFEKRRLISQDTYIRQDNYSYKLINSNLVEEK